MKGFGITAVVLITLGCIFLFPYVVLLGWNCAREMWPTLPQATYWQAFWISNAIASLFKSRFSNLNNRD